MDLMSHSERLVVDRGGSASHDPTCHGVASYETQSTLSHITCRAHLTTLPATPHLTPPLAIKCDPSSKHSNYQYSTKCT